VKPKAKNQKDQTRGPRLAARQYRRSLQKTPARIYLLYIGFLAYCALTVVSTTDRQIVLNEPAKLPIINVEVALNGIFLPSDLFSFRAPKI